MTEGVKPIETVYKGYRFRSRLEARWAVFFEVAGEEWEYEPEGYDLPDGRYLPDFHLARRGVYVEIKPEGRSLPDATDKASSLSLYGRRPIMVVQGRPWPREHRVILMRADGFGTVWAMGEFGADASGDKLVFATHVEWESPYAVRKILFELGYLHSDDLQHAKEQCGRIPDGSGSGRINEAFRAARGARFEHGEHGDAPKRKVVKGADGLLLQVFTPARETGTVCARCAGEILPGTGRPAPDGSGALCPDCVGAGRAP